MPTYKYRCSGCGDERIEVMTFAEHDAYDPGIHLCPLVQAASSLDGVRMTALDNAGEWRQVLNFSFTRPMAEHYNPSVGARISSEREASEHLKRQSEEATARTGVEHNYELVDPSEPAAAGVTDQGMEATERKHRELGWSESKSKIL